MQKLSSLVNLPLTNRLVGGASVLWGIWWCCEAVLPPIRTFWSGEFESGDVFFLSFVPLLILPDILAIVFGTHLFFEICESSLKGVIGATALFFGIFLSSWMSEFLTDILPEGLQYSVSMFTSTLIAVVAYITTVQILLHRCLQSERSWGALIGRPVLILVAFELWLLLSEVFRVYSPVREGFQHLPKEPWGMLGTLVPLIVATGVYKLSSRNLQSERQTAKTTESPSSQTVSG